jgi:hypothetical protein
MAACVAAGDVAAQTAPPPSAGAAATAQDPPPAARPRQGQGRAAARGATDAGMAPIAVAELQRLFDAYFVMQAQDALKLDDTQFAQFLPRLKAVQDARRRNEQARHQLVAELAKLTAPAATLDEAHVKERLRALHELDARAAGELQRAYEALDQILDVRQQARFRVFEQNMERRKLELMLRAQRSQAPAAGPGRRP